MKNSSITRRLILALTSLIVLFWLVAIGFSFRAMQHEFDEIFDSAQQEVTQRLLALVLDELRVGDADDERSIALTNPGARHEYLTYQLRDGTGRIVLRSRDAPSMPYDVPLRSGFSNTATHRIYTEASADGTLFMQVADRFKNRQEAARESSVALLIPLILLIPLSIFAVWFTVGRSLKPLERLRRDIATKDGGNLAEVAGEDLPRELKPIARSVNLLLQRLRAALEAEREFTANSAHELRTPIAGALAQTQRLREELPPGPQRDRAGQVEASLLGLGRLAEKLLQLARAEAGIGGSATPADLKPVLDMVVNDFERDPRAEGRITYVCPPGIGLVRNADIDAFAIVIRNLIENAILHGDPRRPVVVSLDDRGVIGIVNDMPAEATLDLSDLRKRFKRGRTQGPGSGLGLAIVERILAQMGGRLDLVAESGEIARFEARVSLPAA